MGLYLYCNRSAKLPYAQCPMFLGADTIGSGLLWLW
jgi:hypothetical protein